MAHLMDAVMGAAVGDALGVPFEFRTRGTFRCHGMVGMGTHGQPKGTWSDDTSMILATCDSLYANRGRVNVSDMRFRFERWLYGNRYTCDGRVFDCGFSTSTALERGYGMGGESDCGNGSLMRVVPLAFTDASDREVRMVSAITHSHPDCTGSCVSLVHIARDLIVGATPQMAALAEGYGYLDGMPREDVRSGGYVLDTIEAAMWCLVNTDSYRHCVLEAVNLGEDTDTTACVAGALAGIVYGMDSIPGEWIDGLRGKRWIGTYCRDWTGEDQSYSWQ